MCLNLAAIQVYKNRSDNCVGFIAIERQAIKLDLTPPAVVLLEEFIIIATILLVSRKKDKGIWGSRLSDLGDVMMPANTAVNPIS